MKRRVISEFGKSIYAIDIMLYAIISVVGYLLLNGAIDTVGVNNYLVSIFFIFGFFSLLAYFLNRRENDYEFLFFGAINIFVSVFILINKGSNDMNLVISNSLLFYAIGYIINKGLNVYKLFKKKSINFIPKCAISILIFVISIIAVAAIYEKFDVVYLIYGYYFIGFGLLSILEVLLTILMNGKSFKKKMLSFLDYKEEKKEVKKKVEIKKMKQVKGKRITPKKVEEEKKIETTPKVSTKKNVNIKKKNNKKKDNK